MSSVRTRYPAQEKLVRYWYLRRCGGGGGSSRDRLSHHFPTTSFLPTTGAPQKTAVAGERDDLPERRLDLRLRDRAIALGHLFGEVAADAALDETVDRRPTGEVLEGPAHRVRCHLLAEREVLADVFERLVEHGGAAEAAGLGRKQEIAAAAASSCLASG